MVIGPFNLDPILKENVLSLLYNKSVVIPDKGTSKNQSICVDDVNEAIYKSATISSNKIKNFEIFNITGSEILSMNEFLDLVKKKTNSQSNIVHLPLWMVKPLSSLLWSLGKTSVHPSYLDLIAKDQILDIKKAKRILEWEPKCTVEKGLIDSINFLEKAF